MLTQISERKKVTPTRFGQKKHPNIYIYIYIHTYINSYIHTYIHTHIHTYIHTYIHKYIYVSNCQVSSFLVIVIIP